MVRVARLRALGQLLLATTVLGMVACAALPAPRTAAEKAADDAVARRVLAALQAAPLVYADHIVVDSNRGAVRLTGWVYSVEDMRASLRISAAVPGVAQVMNELDVQGSFTRARR